MACMSVKTIDLRYHTTACQNKQIRRHVARVLKEEGAADDEDSDDALGGPSMPSPFGGTEGMDPCAAAAATAAAVTRGRAMPTSPFTPSPAGPIPSARLTGEHAASPFPPPPPLSIGMEGGRLWEFEEVDMDAIDLENSEEDPDEDVMVVETDDFLVRV